MENLKSFRGEVANLAQSTNQPYDKQTTIANKKWDSTPRWLRILGNIALNFFLLAISTLTAYLFCIAFHWVMQAAGEQRISDTPSTEILQEIAILTTMAGFILFTLQDLIKLFDRKLQLPFEFSLNQASSIYWNRIQIYLLAVSFNAILLCLYLSFPSMVLVSAIFLASVFSVAILAIQKSAPRAKIGFCLSLFFFVVVMATIPIVRVMYAPVNTPSEETKPLFDD